MSMQPYGGDGVPALPGDGFDVEPDEPFEGDVDPQPRDDGGRWRPFERDPVGAAPGEDDGGDQGCGCPHEPGCPYGERPRLFSHLLGRLRQ